MWLQLRGSAHHEALHLCLQDQSLLSLLDTRSVQSATSLVDTVDTLTPLAPLLCPVLHWPESECRASHDSQPLLLQLGLASGPRAVTLSHLLRSIEIADEVHGKVTTGAGLTASHQQVLWVELWEGGGEVDSLEGVWVGGVSWDNLQLIHR